MSSVTHDVEGVKTTLALLQNQIHALSPAARSPKTSSSSKLIKVNVGGKMFTTRRSTFENAEGTYFESLVSDRWEVDRDEEGNIFIDRDPKHFSGTCKAENHFRIYYAMFFKNMYTYFYLLTRFSFTPRALFLALM